MSLLKLGIRETGTKSQKFNKIYRWASRRFNIARELPNKTKIKWRIEPNYLAGATPSSGGSWRPSHASVYEPSNPDLIANRILVRSVWRCLCHFLQTPWHAWRCIDRNPRCRAAICAAPIDSRNDPSLRNLRMAGSDGLAVAERRSIWLLDSDCVKILNNIVFHFD